MPRVTPKRGSEKPDTKRRVFVVERMDPVVEPLWYDMFW